MGNPTVRTVLDNGRGLLLPEKKLVDSVILKQKEDHNSIVAAGEYAFETWAEEFEMLVLVCPFCGFAAPMPWLMKVSCKEPLDISQELYCRNCCTFFHIIEGVAYKSWLPIKELLKCLKNS